MTEPSPLDRRGRITIRRDFRARLGRRVVQILTPHGVLLRPVPDKLEGNRKMPNARTDAGEEAASKEAGR